MSNQEELKGIVVDFYSDLFTKNDPTPFVLSQPHGFQVLNFLQVSGLARTVDKEEVRKALFDMGPYKAPGPDCFEVIFFQYQWNLLSNLLTNFIIDARSGNCNWAEINKILLLRVPKM